MKNISLKSFLTILLIASINIAKCQVIIDSLKSKEDYIINTTVYKKGIYKSFEEFKYNSPSITSSFTFNKNNVWLLEDEEKEDRVKKYEYWGFCDGEKIYIRWNKNYELLEKGRYCFFEAKEVNIIPVISSGIPIPVPIPDKDALIINFNNGKVFEISKKLLEHIFETDDQELLKQFKNDNKKNKKYLEYIVLYNERNGDKIK